MKLPTVLYFNTYDADLNEGVTRLQKLLSDGYKITSYCATDGRFVYTLELNN